jgi:hypothetical protein
MSTAKRLLVIALIVPLVLLIFSALAPKAAHAVAATLVQVVNTVDTRVTNAVDTSGSNVNIANTPEVLLKGVDEANPLPTHDIGNRSERGMSAALCATYPPGNHDTQCSGVPASFAVPTTVDGRSVRALVIDFVSGYCVSTTPVSVGLVALDGSMTNYFAVPDSTTSTHVFDHMTRMYINPGKTLQLGVGVSQGTNDAVCGTTINGHYQLE